MPPDPTRVFVYIIKEDTGFAPNPFHGVCSLATCMQPIRKAARPGDLIIGKAGSQRGGRTVFAMEVSGITTFAEYWHDPEFECKLSGSEAGGLDHRRGSDTAPMAG